MAGFVAIRCYTIEHSLQGEGARLQIQVSPSAPTGRGMTPTSQSIGNRRRLGYILSALIISAIMFAGFAKNFYLRAWIGTRPITSMVHVHGWVMTAWVVLFLTQTLLIAKRRSDLHRKLGIAGAFVAFAIVAFGIYTISNSIFRQHPDANLRLFSLLYVAFDGISLLLFGGLVIAALRVRLRPQVHKRLMLMAMLSLLPPAYGRFVAYFTHVGIETIVLGLMCATVLSCIVIDTVRHRRLHPTLAWCGAIVIAVNILTYVAQR
jgi:hypothetical protein